VLLHSSPNSALAREIPALVAGSPLNRPGGLTPDGPAEARILTPGKPQLPSPINGVPYRSPNNTNRYGIANGPSNRRFVSSASLPSCGANSSNSLAEAYKTPGTESFHGRVLDTRVLVLAPFGHDAPEICRVLGGAGLEVEKCSDGHQLRQIDSAARQSVAPRYVPVSSRFGATTRPGGGRPGKPRPKPFSNNAVGAAYHLRRRRC